VNVSADALPESNSEGGTLSLMEIAPDHFPNRLGPWMRASCRKTPASFVTAHSILGRSSDLSGGGVDVAEGFGGAWYPLSDVLGPGWRV